MPIIHFSHDIACDQETFWKLFFDKEFNTKLYLEKLGFPKYEIVEQKETEAGVTRFCKGQPKMNVPGAVQKLLGSNFGYEERGVYDKAKNSYSWKFKPSALEGKLIQDGTVRCDTHGDHVKRVVDITLEAKVFGVGGIIEGAAEKQLREGWNNSAAFMNEWVKKAK